jgi:cytochrome c oxidase subunit 2
MRSLTRKSSLLPLALLPLLTACSKADVSGLGFEEGVTSVNDASLSLWQGAWIAAAVVGGFTLILILWPVFFHRKKDESFPKQTQYNIPVEVAYTVIPFVIVAVLFYFTVQRESRILKITPEVLIAKNTGSVSIVEDSKGKKIIITPEDGGGSVAYPVAPEQKLLVEEGTLVTDGQQLVVGERVSHFIDVVGFQWSWQFKYRDAGDYKSATVTGTPAQPPTLYLPQGQKVRFTLDANDVVHGFWIPAFMIQMQNLPGVTNKLEFTANKLGTYPGRCNILCGRNHSQMLFSVKVVTLAEYEKYLQDLVAEEKAGLA